MISEVFRAIKKHRFPLLILSFTWGLFFIFLFSRSVWFQDGNLVVAHENLWSDWALHIGMIEIFATKSPADWFLYHPIYAGGKFTYPFLANLISAGFMRAGFSLPLSLIIPSILLSFSFLLSAYFLLTRFLKSSTVALIAITLFLFSSGPGFFQFLRDLFSHFNWDTLFYPPRDYSVQRDYGWGTGNVITGMLYPQRAFLLGMPLALTGLLSLFEGLRVQRQKGTAFEDKKAPDHRKYFFLSAVLLGILPISHMHSLIALGVSLLLFVILNRKNKDLIIFFYFPVAALSLALFFTFIAGGIQTKFFHWSPGWTAKGGFVSWLVMWWKLWGLMIPAAIVGFVLFWRDARTSTEEKALGASLFFMFFLGNLILFQPLHWDNTKIFLWCYFFFSAFAARFLYEIWLYSFKGFSPPLRIGLRTLSIVLSVALGFTGFLECVRLQWVRRHSHVMVQAEDIELAEQVRRNTRVDAVFLTAPEHNHPITVFGARAIFLGYTGWVYNFGFPFPQREEEIRSVYAGSPSAERILNDREIDYVAIGPSEIQRYQVNEEFFSCRYELKFRNLNYRIYDVRTPTVDRSSCVNP